MLNLCDEIVVLRLCQSATYISILRRRSITKFELSEFILLNIISRLRQLRLEQLQTESLFALTLFQRTDNESHCIFILRNEDMLEGVHTALSFTQFVCQAPYC